MKYIELISKSNFSFLTGASHPGELIEEAIKQGLSGMAITDINGVYGLGRVYKVARHHKDFKLIIGSELTLTNHPNIILIAKDRKGYGDLCRIVSKSHADKEKGKATLNFQEFEENIKQLGAEALIALARCEDNTNYTKLKEIFNEDLYIPLAKYLDGKDKERIQKAKEAARKYNLKIVANNDVYYHIKERKLLQDVLISIRENKPLNEVGYKLFSNGERYIKSPDKMIKLFSDMPEAIAVTQEISEKCTFCPSQLKYRYPSEWIPKGLTPQEYLEKLVYAEAPNIYKEGIPEKAHKLIQHELSLINQMGYADYFLTIYDIVAYARSINILCQGRGSAANSVICYCLGITAIDPVQMNLLFERFISVERGEPPDIDVDFEHERREEVIQYIYKKYGRDRAAMVSAVVTYQSRSAFREVCKAFGLPVGTLSAKKVQLQFDELTKDLPNKEKLKKKIESLTSQLKEFPRHLSIHSGGFTLSADPIIEIVPVEPARMDGRTIIQWDKYDLDELGLLKVDVLSLGMLSCIRKALELIGKKLHEIPHDDPQTYHMIQHCDTVGTFQIESRAQMSMLGRLQPKNFYDLVIEVAIMRPGPIVGNMVHPFLKRKRGLEKITYPNEAVEKILGKTLGVPLFQEQIMKLAIDLADFTPGEADRLRRSINAWKSSAPIGEMAERLRKGLRKSGMPEKFTNDIFEQIQGFSHYGFPESHAASFALLAYASAYLKCHHHAEFTASLINSQPMGFYRNDTLVHDAIRKNVKFLPICIHKSEWDCKIEAPNTIRLGFKIVKGIAEKDVQELIHERQMQKFTDLTDFLKRSTIRKDVLHRFALAGRLSSKNMDQRQTLWALLEYENLFSSQSENQMSFFNDCYGLEEKSDQDFQQIDSYGKISQDYQAFQVSVHGHPMAELRQSIKNLPRNTSKEIKLKNHGTQVTGAGMVLVRQKPPTAKGTTFCTIEDEGGFLDLVLHKDTYEKYKEVFMMNSFIVVSGALQKDGFTVSILVKSIKSFEDLEPQMQVNLIDRDPTTYFSW